MTDSTPIIADATGSEIVEIPPDVWALVHITTEDKSSGSGLIGYMPLFNLSDEMFDAIVNAVFED